MHNYGIYRPNIKILHLLNNPTETREAESIKSISKLKDLNFNYKQIINPLYTSLPPKEFCDRPNDISMTPGYYLLTPGHYGCFLAHKESILNNTDADALLICECDCKINVNTEEFAERIKFAYQSCIKFDLMYVSFGPMRNGSVHNLLEDNLYEADRICQTHCMLIPSTKFDYFKNKFETCPWDTIDAWYDRFFTEYKKAIFDIPYAIQLPGTSYLDLTYKN